MSGWVPPEAALFSRPAPPAGSGSRSISLSGLTIVLDGLDPDAETFVAHRFRRYLLEARPAKADLQVEFFRSDAAPYLDRPPDHSPDSIYRMQHAVRDERLFYTSGTVCARLDLRTGRATALTRPRTGTLAIDDPTHMAMENLLRPFLAWTVLLKGGFMLHAASVVRDGRCYLFFGNSGAGKSTIAAICGGQVISDDLTMVLPEGDGYSAIGSPFRGTYTACEDLTGRYPVVGLYRLRKDTRVFVETPVRAIAFSEFVANLPFVVGEIDNHPAAWPLVRAAFEKLPVTYLHFRRDDSFWAVI
jgi:hypothetical protein